jgi:nickel transport protein
MIRTFLVSLMMVLVLASPAAAHKLKVFAAVEGNQISGYGFFIGGSRAQETDWVAKDKSGTVLAQGKTDTDGRFAFSAPEPITSDITVTLNTEEGHIASATLTAERFGAESVDPVSEITTPETSTSPKSEPSPVSNERTAALVEAAVQRQVEPLLERIEQMDDRLRYTDILSGIFLIVGLAGIGLWARGLRRK